MLPFARVSFRKTRVPVGSALLPAASCRCALVISSSLSARSSDVPAVARNSNESAFRHCHRFSEKRPLTRFQKHLFRIYSPFEFTAVQSRAPLPLGPALRFLNMLRWFLALLRLTEL